MTPLRQQLLPELVLRGCAERMQEAYIQQVYQLAKHFRQVPDQLTNEQVRAYLLHLAQERKLAGSTINQAVNTFRCLYERVAQQTQTLLPVPYFHLVFTLPHCLNGLIRQSRAALFKLLLDAATQTLLEFGAERLVAQSGFDRGTRWAVVGLPGPPTLCELWGLTFGRA